MPQFSEWARQAHFGLRHTETDSGTVGSTDAGPRQESLKSNLSKDWFEEFKDSHQRSQVFTKIIPLIQTPDEKIVRNVVFNRKSKQLMHLQVHPSPGPQPRPLGHTTGQYDSQSSKSNGGEEQCSIRWSILNKNLILSYRSTLQSCGSLDSLFLVFHEHHSCSILVQGEKQEWGLGVLPLKFLKKLSTFLYILHGQYDKLKSDLQKRFHIVFEGVAKAANSAPLSKIYTDLYIIEGEASENNQEHEVRHLERASRRPAVTETIITCENILKACPQSPEPRVVLTKGVAGVGKTVLTQKFSLDWAEGRANQELQMVFPFTFRDLNLLRDKQFSLVELLHHFFSSSKALCSSQQLQVLFIFDGLDECRLPLDFGQTPVLSDPTESVSLDVLLVNLIKGNLLPTARLWITTRHAAANLIPAECVSMVTEVIGFIDWQKELYFRKRFRDDTIISHIKSIRSLYIMSHIPIFCWILSTVIQKLLEQTEKPELPQTLTKMYVHFLVVQAKVQKIKYQQGSGADLHWTPETREMVLSLGKLAFEQLQKGNLIFYECDLSECGLDAKAVSKDSGVFTQVLKEESGLYQNKVYCFIHLTVQEFLAALHVHQTFFSSGENLMGTPNSSEKPESEVSFYCSAVDQALQSPNGHLDLFLRFLLGLSLPTNQKLLEGLLTQTGSNQTTEETVKYIKQKLDEKDLSAERSLNLLNCLNELDDLSLVKEMQKNWARLSFKDISPAYQSALCYLLLASSDADEFDLRKYDPSETALLRLLPVVKASTKAIVSGCELSPLGCERLASVLSSSSVTYLDLSHNDLQDTGVELLCDALKNAPCRLKTLRLSPAGKRWMVPGLKKYFCDLSLDPNTAYRHLSLSDDNRTMTWVKEAHQRPNHEDRFTYYAQVLGDTELKGCCYWEVDWAGQGGVSIAATYKGISRKGKGMECRFGDNDLSWSLRICDGDYFFWHNNIYTSNISSGKGGVPQTERACLQGEWACFWT
ncbi:hypothetical protein WMY93_026974 [Mugilogobius chulae]|uniref:NACHT domain-containing protein n=1 Tax=Mugilogobius chulae TaxID=88201 RepID=A0AAW0MSM8_9GOBI